MEQTENCIVKRMTEEELLNKMEKIAAPLISELYFPDLIADDLEFVIISNAGIPFIWMIYDSGTFLFPLNSERSLRTLINKLNLYEIIMKQDFLLYQYDGYCLFPVYPAITRLCIASDLSYL